MTRSRLFSLAVTMLVALAGLSVRTAPASITGTTGSAVLSTHPPACW